MTAHARCVPLYTCTVLRKFWLFRNRRQAAKRNFTWVVEFLKNRNELTTWPNFTSHFRNELNTLKIPTSNAPYSTVVEYTYRRLSFGCDLLIMTWISAI